MSDDFRIIRLVAPNPGPLTGPGTNTYVVGDSSGSLVIDPGCDDPAHLQAIVTAGATLGTIHTIIVTHAHPDHIEGTSELAHLTGAAVLARHRAPGGVPFATAEVCDGEQIPVGGHTLTVLATPGHRFDHVCVWHAATGTLFAGDLLAGSGTVVIIPPEGDMRQYLASLEMLLALPLRTIWPGHGPAITDPPERITGYIAHRLERERQVLAALQDASTPQTVTALVPVVYAATDPAMYTWAALSLLAHLLKLEHEGRVTRLDPATDAGPWKIV